MLTKYRSLQQFTALGYMSKTQKRTQEDIGYVVEIHTHQAHSVGHATQKFANSDC